MALFFNSVTGQYEDDGKSQPQQGFMPSYSQNLESERYQGRELFKDMQANPENYPVNQMVPQIQSQPQPMTQSSEAPSMPTAPRADLVGFGVNKSMAPVMPSKMVNPFAGGYGLQAQAVSEEMKAGYDRAKAQGEYYRQIKDMNNSVDMDFKERLSQSQKMIQEQMDNLKAVTDEVQQGAKINPDKFWEDKTTGQKVGAAIAIAMGALGGALQGTGRNSALDIINNAIDRDISAQEKNYLSKKDSLAASQSLLGQYERRMDNIEASRQLAKRDQLLIAEMKLNETLAGVSGKEAQAKGLMLKGQLANERAKLDMQIAQMVGENAQMQSIMSGGSVNPTRLPKEFQDKLVKVGNEYKIAVSPKAASDITEKTAAMDAFTEKANELKDLLGTTSGLTRFASLPTKDRERIKTLASDLAPSYSKLKGMGAFDQGTAQVVEKIIGSPESALISPIAKAKLNQAIDAIQIDKENLFNTGIIGYKKLKKGK